MKRKVRCVPKGGGSGFAYFLGMIGSAVYYVGQAEGFWSIVVALLKAIVWPAFVVYDLLKFIGV
ncbi:hypothetical protein JXB11_02370 [Candidatus Woesearchaeota archaeon]|nr:hypothetical protein [Candidatus Woesearchaeota archaeon]